jgi:uncharacterized glyoxalase superfamily protein PhnB
MNPHYKPNGYNSVSPYIIIDGAQRFKELMKTVFDAKELRCFERPDGTIMHAEVQVDDSVIMFSDATASYPPVPSVLHVYVSNVDETFNKAILAGCKVVEHPKEMEGDVDKRGTFLDFGGNMWSVATEVRE